MGSLADHITSGLYPNDTKLSVADRLIRYFSGLHVGTGTPPASLDSAPVGSTWTDIETGKVYTKTPTGWVELGSGGGGGTALITRDEGTTAQAATAIMNFVGAGVTVTSAAGGTATVTIPGGSGTVTAPVLITSSAVGMIPMTLKGFAGQTGDLQQWQDSAAAVKAKIDFEGSLTSKRLFVTDSAWNSVGTLNPGIGGATLTIANNGIAGQLLLMIRGSASQTANLQEWRDSSDAVMARIEAGGKLIFGPNANSPMVFGAINNLFLQAGTSGITIRSASTSTLATIEDSGRVSMFQSNPANQGLIVKGAGSQSANLQEWRKSDDTVLMNARADGSLQWHSTIVTSLVTPHGATLQHSAASWNWRFKNTSDATILDLNADRSAVFAGGFGVGSGQIAPRVLDLNPPFPKSGTNEYIRFQNGSDAMVGRIAWNMAWFWGGLTTTTVELTLKAFAAQTSNMLEFTDSADALLMAVDPAGHLKWVTAKQQTTVGAAGGASAPPATPLTWLRVKNAAGTTLVIPAYNAS